MYSESIPNRILDHGAADPWLFYHNGYYYLTITAGTKLKVWKSETIGGLRHTEPKIVFEPEPGHEWSRDLWSPEIHYYSEKDFGPEVAGWYLLIAMDDGYNINHRMYVLKSINGEPDGQYVNPVTLEPNVPQKIVGVDDPSINNEWAVGVTDVRVNGSLYTMWVGERGRGTNDFYQFIALGKMLTPWQISGKMGIICTPTEKWEMGGSGPSASGKIMPKVVEGGTPVYTDDGNVIIVYTGSGYWSKHYAMGQLKYLGGDPLVQSSWKKEKDTIFSMSDKICGCGHCSFTQAPSGEKIICYHAYIGNTANPPRYSFIDTYQVVDGNVVIGDGSRHPKDDGTIINLGVKQ